MNRMTRTLAFATAAAGLAVLAGCTHLPEPPFSLAPTEVSPVALLELPEGYVAPSDYAPVTPWDLPADYAAPQVAGYDASLDVPAPVTVVEG